MLAGYKLALSEADGVALVGQESQASHFFLNNSPTKYVTFTKEDLIKNLSETFCYFYTHVLKKRSQRRVSLLRESSVKSELLSVH